MAETLHPTPLPADLAAAMQARRAAMLAHELPALAALLDPTLRYTHSNGVCEDKATYLAALGRGAYRYHAIAEKAVEAFDLDGALWCCGRAAMHASVHGAERRMDNRFVALWRRTPQGLTLAAYGAIAIQAR